MKTIEHFKKLHDIIKQEGVKPALSYAAIEIAKRHPKLSKIVADFYLDCISPKQIKITYRDSHLKALPDYTGKLAIFEIIENKL